MRAIRLHQFGPPSGLVLDELPDLEPGADQVRVAVQASGVHLVDTVLRRGEGAGYFPLPELPTVPGREVAGVVDRVGELVDPAWQGRRVVAHLGQVPGGYAEQAVTSPDRLFPLPAHVDAAQAVAMVGTGRTARAVPELEPPGALDTVLVPAAAGGLGWLLVQAAQRAGARVVAAAGGEAKLARLAHLGPDLVVDYDKDDWSDRVRTTVGGVTLVYDGVGGRAGRAALDLLEQGGRQVMFGWSSGQATRFDSDDVVSRGLTVSWSLGPRMAGLPGGIPGLATRALDDLAAGRWTPLLTTYPLSDAARAHDDLEDRATVGKVVLLTDQASETRSA